MRRYIVIVMLILASILTTGHISQAAQTQCSTTTLGQVCAIVTGDHLKVTLLGTPIIDMEIPPTVIRIPVPGPTITLPRVTITRPGVTIPGPTVVTQAPPVTITVGPTGQDGRRTATITSVPTGQSTGSQSTSPSTRVIHKNTSPRTVTVTKAKAFAFGLGLVLLGLLLAFLIMILYYYLGWKGREREDNKFFNSMREDVQRITKG